MTATTTTRTTRMGHPTTLALAAAATTSLIVAAAWLAWPLAFVVLAAALAGGAARSAWVTRTAEQPPRSLPLTGSTPQPPPSSRVPLSIGRDDHGAPRPRAVGSRFLPDGLAEVPDHLQDDGASDVELDDRLDASGGGYDGHNFVR